MADRFQIDYERSLRRFSGRFEGLSVELDRELEATVASATDLLYEQAQENIRSLFKTSGKMASALDRRVRRLGPGHVVGRVGIRGVGYVTQERGGAKPYTITPRSGNALRFVVADGPVFAKSVRRQPLPRRSYLAEALRQKRAEIRALFDGFSARAWSRSE